MHTQLENIETSFIIVLIDSLTGHQEDESLSMF